MPFNLESSSRVDANAESGSELASGSSRTMQRDPSSEIPNRTRSRNRLRKACRARSSPSRSKYQVTLGMPSVWHMAEPATGGPLAAVTHERLCRPDHRYPAVVSRLGPGGRGNASAGEAAANCGAGRLRRAAARQKPDPSRRSRRPPSSFSGRSCHRDRRVLCGHAHRRGRYRLRWPHEPCRQPLQLRLRLAAWAPGSRSPV